MLAAAVLSLFLFQASDGAAPAMQPSSGSARFDQCVTAIDADAAGAYEQAMAWANETRELAAFRCAAMALVEQGRFDQGARRLESLGTAAEGFDAYTRAALFTQAGHAWLLARDPSRARSAFARTIASLGDDRAALPDALIDRAIAYSGEGEFRLAEEDLNRALDLRPNDALALRLRAMARMRQSAFDLALADAEAALRAAPADVEAALTLGHVREAQRTGRPIDPETLGEAAP